MKGRIGRSKSEKADFHRIAILEGSLNIAYLERPLEIVVPRLYTVRAMKLSNESSSRTCKARATASSSV